MNEKKIKIYKRNGDLQSTYELTNEELERVTGKLSKVVLTNDDSVEGYADPFRVEGKDEYDGKIHDYIYLWTFKNLDEEKQIYDVKDGIELKKVYISDIKELSAILYSHPRWGGRLTNKFSFSKKKTEAQLTNNKNNEQEFTEYYESIEQTERKNDISNFENTVKLKGYLTKKPSQKILGDNIKCTRFTLAVKRNYKNINGIFEYDYISILCWKDLAEKAMDYDKDDFVELEGHIQTRSYISEQNEKKFAIEIYCTKIEKI